MKITGCRPEFLFILLVCIVISLVFGPVIYYSPIISGENNSGSVDLTPVIILSNPANMPSMPIGF